MTPARLLPAHARVGLTTTIPVEVVLAANLIPVDLNNLFIAAPDALKRVARAEAAGLPRTICAWVRGIYASLQDHPEIRAVLVATQGDCSYTQALGEILESEGREVIHFQFPYPRDRGRLREEIEALMARLGTNWQEVAKIQERLGPVRRLLRELDRLTWETGQVSGQENFQVLIASSDFASDLDEYDRQIDRPGGGRGPASGPPGSGTPGFGRHPAYFCRPVELPGRTGRRRGL